MKKDQGGIEKSGNARGMPRFEKREGGWPTLSLILLGVRRSCRVFRDGAGTLTLTVAEEPRGILADRKSKPPPCVCKERRHKDGAPF
jgi:hypothetical protein